MPPDVDLNIFSMEPCTENYTFKTMVDFRPAREEDVGPISKICPVSRASKEYWQCLLHNYIKNEFNPHHALPDRIVYVATREESVIAFIAGHLTHRSNYPGHLQWIAVEKDYQRKGIGSELLWKMGDWFIKKDTRCVRADVERWQTDLVNFYYNQKAERINTRGVCWNNIGTLMRN